MTPAQNYAAILESYFGRGTASAIIGLSESNIVTGALNRTNDFTEFRAAFPHRLQRLAQHYRRRTHSRTELLNSVINIARASNWEGAYAETVAFDFLNSEDSWLLERLQISKTLTAKSTLASSLGLKNINYDAWAKSLGVYIDIKTLSDKSGAILRGLIADTHKKLGLKDVTIQPEYPLDTGFSIFEKHRRALQRELQTSISSQRKPSLIRSKVLPCVSYRLLWGPGMVSAVSTYHPHKHAATHHRLLFQHAKKFHRHSPSIIVFVVFPWFSESVLNSKWGNEHFYRAFCRRFFCQYVRDTSPAKTSLPGFVGGETIGEVTRRLSGVMFLEDTSITSKTPGDLNVDAYAYLNPNATNKVSRHFREYLSSLRIAVDDFEHDNY